MHNLKKTLSFYLFIFFLLLSNLETAICQLSNGYYFINQSCIKYIQISKASEKSFILYGVGHPGCAGLSNLYEKVPDSINQYVAYRDGKIVSLIRLKEDYALINEISGEVTSFCYVIAPKLKTAIKIGKKKQYLPMQGVQYPPYPFCKKNAGKILFSEDPIEKRTETNEDFFTEYNLDDPLAFNIYCKQTIPQKYAEDFPGMGLNVDIKYVFYLDGEKIDNYIHFRQLDSELKGFAWSQCVFGYQESCVEKLSNAIWNIFLKKDSIKKESYELKVQAFIYNNRDHTYDKEKPIAEGVLNITVAQKLKNRFLRSNIIEYGMKDAELEAEILKAVKRYAKDKDSKKKEYAEFTDIVIASRGWDIETVNSAGEIKLRSIIADGYYKDFDGFCKYKTFFLRQYYDGEDYQRLHCHREGPSKIPPCIATPSNKNSKWILYGR